MCLGVEVLRLGRAFVALGNGILSLAFCPEIMKLNYFTSCLSCRNAPLYLPCFVFIFVIR